jgi:hypothetical protein
MPVSRGAGHWESLLTSPRELTRGGAFRNRWAGSGVLRSPEAGGARKKLNWVLEGSRIRSAVVDSQHCFALRRAASRRDGAGPCPSVRTSPPSCEETEPTVSASATPPRPGAPCSSAAARRGGSGSLLPRRRSSRAGRSWPGLVPRRGFPVRLESGSAPTFFVFSSGARKCLLGHWWV